MEKYIYRILNSSALVTEIDGRVYRHGMRPRDAKSEDIIVRLVSGDLGQHENGTVEIVLYVPQLSVGRHTDSVDDLARIQWLTDLLREVIEEHNGPRVNLSINSEPQVRSLPERRQTEVKVTLEYTFTNS